MRTFLTFIYCLLFISTFAFAQSKDSEEIESDSPIVQFQEQEFDFGNSMEGETLQHCFKFVNKGNEPLLISNVLTSCGCTIVDWSREPIYPGKKGEIITKLNTKNAAGLQNKTIIILSNSSNNIERIKLTTNVLPREQAQITN